MKTEPTQEYKSLTNQIKDLEEKYRQKRAWYLECARTGSRTTYSQKDIADEYEIQNQIRELKEKRNSIKI